ncbi:flagellar hook-associated protein FlgK [Rhizobium sp. CG4]|uniref:flagellar hook-associated protein FlgK n=1 Tax=Rhizobium sp. CG4 TaxID=2726075 RepID=UPI0020341624|nr:flagellar hook-associated protein FlgK [Rhizobium sp. CG4]MCM2456240.1 flagellar hook-associated protein FlgK [Rhizobium sp. CG4]
MSLSSAMITAQSIFNNTGKQTDVVSSNIANVGNKNYVKRTAILSATAYGASVVTTARVQNDSLLRQTLASSSLFSGQNVLLTGLEEVKSIFGGNDYESSPSAYLGALQKSLDTYAGKPGDSALAATVVNAATDLATSLNTASNELQAIRTRADKEMALQVDSLNQLLSRFEVANNAVKSATASGADPNDALDIRDSLLKDISSIVGVSVVTRGDNDMALYTSDQGITLFETIPRQVSFTPKIGYTASMDGNSLYIDGVAVKAGEGSNTTASGSLSGLLQLRDDVVPTMQNQLDEIARGLITLFAEKQADSTGTDPDLPGLFTYNDPATATVPAAGTITKGLAAAIKVHPDLIISQGGNPELLRDGGINGAAYVKNDLSNGGGTGYSALIRSYVTALDTSIDFDPTTRIDTDTSLLKYASNSMGWLEQMRQGATNANDVKTAAYERAEEVYSNTTGVSLDEELSLLLDIEQSYKAATKLVSTIDEMLQSLMSMVK